MMTRAVLVGMVAALGFTVPTWPDVQGWVNAAHAWTAHQLAVWDACPRRTGYDFARLPFAPMTPRFEPIVADDRSSDPGEELNRFAEAADIAPASIVIHRQPAEEGTTRSSGGPVCRDLAMTASAVTPEVACMAEWLREVERPASEVRAMAVPPAIRTSKDLVAHVDCSFSPSVEARSLPVASTPRIDPIAPDDARPDIATELNRFGERVETTSPTPSVSTASRPRFEPINPGPALDTGLAFELNRASDGMALAWDTADALSQVPTTESTLIAPGSADRPSPSVPTTDVAQAIRLTGEAVQAWMKIMTGPAVVQVSVR